MRLGMTELILVFIVALFALGPDRLPAYAWKLGETVSQFKKYSEEATREIKESVVKPLCGKLSNLWRTWIKRSAAASRR